LTAVGAPAGFAGIAGALGADAGPVPTSVTADTRNRYEVPLTSPVMVAVAVGDVPSASTFHVLPPSRLDSTT
jgi:hypothetical protein